MTTTDLAGPTAKHTANIKFTEFGFSKGFNMGFIFIYVNLNSNFQTNQLSYIYYKPITREI